MKRHMIKFRKEKDYLVIHTVAKEADQVFRWKRKSDRFYLRQELLKEAMKTDRNIIDRDIHNFCEVSVLNAHNIVRFCFTWVKSYYSSEAPYVAKSENIYIPLDGFCDFLNSDAQEYSALDIQDQKPSRIIFTESAMKTVKKISPAIKRKLFKALGGHLFSGTSMLPTVEFFSDFEEHSFCWREVVDGKIGLNGGLIFHRDHDCPDDLTKGYYGIHT